MQSETSTVILSHRKDADGLASAAILKIAFPGARVYLSDYSDMVETMAGIVPPGRFLISDLALNDGSFPGFLGEVERLERSGTTVQYIDHHVLKPNFEESLRQSGLDVYHHTEESAAVLAFKKYSPSLQDATRAKILAACGAITDLMDGGSVARKIISSFDRQFLLYEATVLAFTISLIRKEATDLSQKNSKLLDITDRLAKGALPHELPRAIEYSQSFAESAAAMLIQLKSEGTKAGSFAYVKTDESSTGNVAYALIGVFNVPVGIAYRADGMEHYEVSLRATDDYPRDLSVIVGTIAKKLGTSGGGHSKASGTRIKQDQLSELFSLLQAEI
jgi:oligoribonuclease NrnB/cAMP/cGMP phosphodiesterase (DHH superfamily)